MEKNYFTHNHDLNPQILTWILLEIEKPQTVIPGRNKALYYIENLYFTTYANTNYKIYWQLLFYNTMMGNKIKFKKAGSCFLWNLGCAVHCGMCSSFSVKSNFLNNNM